MGKAVRQQVLEENRPGSGDPQFGSEKRKTQDDPEPPFFFPGHGDWPPACLRQHLNPALFAPFYDQGLPFADSCFLPIDKTQEGMGGSRPFQAAGHPLPGADRRSRRGGQKGQEICVKLRRYRHPVGNHQIPFLPRKMGGREFRHFRYLHPGTAQGGAEKRVPRPGQ